LETRASQQLDPDYYSLRQLYAGAIGRQRADRTNLQQDFPTLMALIYIDAIVVMVSILLADILYVLADPRISFEGQGGSA
jgi:ABC-type microcin C transport system permease subunit YejB